MTKGRVAGGILMSALLLAWSLPAGAAEDGKGPEGKRPRVKASAAELAAVRNVGGPAGPYVGSAVRFGVSSPVGAMPALQRSAKDAQ
ncbi:MAG: hypothetical protein HY997_18860, partial [Mycolicibacterium neoaurum]|nr:hypothetical protein [Mycolicibacterium neoaurum]